ncbi:hypothetical protein L1987_07840 [Smallanthus sonchifolius]|uniref:Uncharacterized protein n=1 Tax=Smallanthus sonchifolius TaxID=185202 RepID=A0ACB9JL80_9ASTR|nr:hypothetical protein L1987_07840 [Smallanthus sonchifolius]
MILGKRPRPPIKRTTSMTEFTLDLNHTAVVPAANNSQSPFDPSNPFIVNPPPDHRFLTATISPRNPRRNSADHHMQTPHFLTVCRLCNRRLIPGRDIFMYRGDSAFCSSECRQEQMIQDEKKDKQPLLPKKLVSVDSEYSSNPSKIG